MSAGRRGLLLSVAFFALALWLCPGPRAHAQFQTRPGNAPVDPQAGRHTIWQQNLSPDQIRQLLAKFGQGDKEAGNALEDLIRDEVLKKNPNADPKQVDASIKKLLADKEFMNRMMDLAQKHKNQNPNRDPNELKLTPEDIAKLKNLRPNGPNADPFKLPKFDPDNLPPFDPKNFDPKNFDPEQFPHADPKNPPKIDPDTGLPLDPKTGRPFDPRTGQPLDPTKPPKPGDPEVPPPVKPTTPPENGNPPPPPPKVDPNTGQPVKPPEPEEKPRFDPENPLGTPKDSPEKVAKTKAVETATALWEKNVGPIDESPAVKRAIFDLVSDPEAMDALTDSKGNSIFDMFKDAGDNEGMKDLFSGGDGKGWEWPKLDLKLDWGKNSPNIDVGNAPSKNRWPDSSGSNRWPSGSGLDGMGSFNLGGMQVPWLLALILLAVIVAVIVWWKWEAIFQPGPKKALAYDGLGPWPIDPREINTREDVVKAFEYLSVLICGPGAKTWTHSTIADELTNLAATHGDTAMKLARLYELARYAPLDEPLTRVELLEARRLVCDLAGMD